MLVQGNTGSLQGYVLSTQVGSTGSLQGFVSRGIRAAAPAELSVRLIASARSISALLFSSVRTQFSGQIPAIARGFGDYLEVISNEAVLSPSIGIPQFIRDEQLILNASVQDLLTSPGLGADFQDDWATLTPLLQSLGSAAIDFGGNPVLARLQTLQEQVADSLDEIEAGDPGIAPLLAELQSIFVELQALAADRPALTPEIRWLVEHEDGDTLPVVDFGYDQSPGQLNQLSLQLVGDVRDRFPRGIPTRVSLYFVQSNRSVLVARMVCLGGGSLQSTAAGSSTRVECRSDGSALIDQQISLSFVPASGGRLAVYQADSAVRYIRNRLNDLILFVMESVGFRDPLISNIFNHKVDQIVLLDKTPWDVLAEVAEVYSAVLSFDDAARAVILQVPENDLTDPVALGAWDESLSEDNPTVDFFNALTVSGVAEDESPGNRILRSFERRSRLVDPPTGNSSANQTRTVEVTETRGTRYLRDKRLTRQDQEVITEFVGFPLFQSVNRSREDFTFSPVGQEVLFTRIEQQTGPIDRTFPATLGTLGSLLWGIAGSGARFFQVFRLEGDPVSPNSAQDNPGSLIDLPLGNPFTGAALPPDSVVDLDPRDFPVINVNDYLDSGFGSAYVKRKVDSWAGIAQLTLPYAARATLMIEGIKTVSLTMDPD